MKQSKTNELTQRIIEHLYSLGVFAWRQNTLPVPMVREGVFSGFRPAGKSGVPDICAILPPGGRYVGIEIKTGKDRLRPEQIGFHSSVGKVGAVVLVVKDYEDFLEQFSHLATELSTL